MKTMPTATTATMNDGTRISAAGDQIVVVSGITPACCSRKLPGVAISSGALPDRPNCQIAPAPASTDISQRKSILMPLRSAWVAKWMAMTGASAIDRPQFRYATKPPAMTASRMTCGCVRGRRDRKITAFLNAGVAPRMRLNTRMSVICIVNCSSIHRPR